MGLGKTLMSITILWTLMCQGMEGKPAVTHTIITCPVSCAIGFEPPLASNLHPLLLSRVRSTLPHK